MISLVNRTKIILVFVLITCFSIIVNTIVISGATNTEVESAAVSAYREIKKIEEKNGDTSQLITEMNEALDVLNESNYFILQSDTQTSVNLENQFIESITIISKKAINQYDSIKNIGQSDLFNVLLFDVIIIAIIFIINNLLERIYVNKMREMVPEIKK